MKWPADRAEAIAAAIHRSRHLLDAAETLATVGEQLEALTMTEEDTASADAPPGTPANMIGSTEEVDLEHEVALLCRISIWLPKLKQRAGLPHLLVMRHGGGDQQPVAIGVHDVGEITVTAILPMSIFLIVYCARTGRVRVMPEEGNAIAPRRLISQRPHSIAIPDILRPATDVWAVCQLGREYLDPFPHEHLFDVLERGIGTFLVAHKTR